MAICDFVFWPPFWTYFFSFLVFFLTLFFEPSQHTKMTTKKGEPVFSDDRPWYPPTPSNILPQQLLKKCNSKSQNLCQWWSKIALNCYSMSIFIYFMWNWQFPKISFLFTFLHISYFSTYLLNIIILSELLIGNFGHICIKGVLQIQGFVFCKIYHHCCTSIVIVLYANMQLEMHTSVHVILLETPNWLTIYCFTLCRPTTLKEFVESE